VSPAKTAEPIQMSFGGGEDAHGPKEPCNIRWRYIWAPPGEYSWTIRARRLCGLSLYHYWSNLLLAASL